MQEFFIHPEDNEQKFHELCQLFEITYPHFRKENLLLDPLDNELIQAYHCQDKRAVIILERLWFFEIILRVNFDPTDFLEALNT